jgi:hypothetical protein
MANIYSITDAARAIGARLIRRNSAVASATKNHELCFYKYLESVHELDKRLRKMEIPDARKALTKRYGAGLPATEDSAMFAVKLTHPKLDPRTQWKYAAVLRFVREKKKPDQSMKSFVKAHGGINALVKEAKTLRLAAKRGDALRKHAKK